MARRRSSNRTTTETPEREASVEQPRSVYAGVRAKPVTRRCACCNTLTAANTCPNCGESTWLQS